MSFKMKTAGSQKAFTLVEMLMAMGVGSVVLTAVATTFLYTGRSFATMANYADLDSTSRAALDIMTRDIRQVQCMSSFSSNQLTFTDFDFQTLSFIYNPEKRTLSRIKGGEVKVLLRECDELFFHIWQRNPVPGTFDLVPTTDAELCKAIDVTWVCSRRILGQRVNTESVQTARIVIRKQQ